VEHLRLLHFQLACRTLKPILQPVCSTDTSLLFQDLWLLENYVVVLTAKFFWSGKALSVDNLESVTEYFRVLVLQKWDVFEFVHGYQRALNVAPNMGSTWVET
jgi:hypothetical protein